MSDTLYIKMDQAVEITKKQVTVGNFNAKTKI